MKSWAQTCITFSIEKMLYPYTSELVAHKLWAWNYTEKHFLLRKYAWEKEQKGRCSFFRSKFVLDLYFRAALFFALFWRILDHLAWSKKFRWFSLNLDHCFWSKKRAKKSKKERMIQVTEHSEKWLFCGWK